MSRRTFALALFAIVLLGATLRGLFPTADPPWRGTVGVVWHDEGAWTHNARNRALFGTWRTDAWNPMYIAPVFTGLEYAAFEAFGVGTWQARIVSQIGGTLAVLLIGLGVTRLGGRQAGLIAAGLLATNYVGLMYDRAAIMESSMTAFLVAGWYATLRAAGGPRIEATERESAAAPLWQAPLWGAIAGLCAVLAYFTKAAAAFFIGSLVLNSLWTLAESRLRRPTGYQDSLGDVSIGDVAIGDLSIGAAASEARRESSAALWTLAGLTICGLLAIALFVLPSWTEYRFYNWQMSVTRKPSYSLKAIVDRVTWVPILHDIFSRMWIVWALAIFAWFSRLVTWPRLRPAERLLTLWIGAGLLELLVHDVGNERRFVFLIPALTALAALLLGRDRTLLPPAVAAWRARAPRPHLALWLLIGYLAYLLVGPIARLPWLYEVRPGVRLSAAIAVLIVGGIFLTWPRFACWCATTRVTPRAAAMVCAIAIAVNLYQFWRFASAPTFKNYEASRAIGRILPPGTLVHGKLANGLSLENRIHPIFVGHEFGNYADRLERQDVPFILTYIEPEVGYEGDVILDVLAAYPQRRILRTFDVAETTGGRDKAALIEKGPPVIAAPLRELPASMTQPSARP